MTSEAKRAYNRARYRSKREAICEQQRRYRQANLEARRAYDRERYYRDDTRKKQTLAGQRRRKGIVDAHRYDELLSAQGGACAICGTVDFGKKSPHADHDHKNGKMRGVLCNHCNVGLGMFKDSSELMAKAMVYLATSRANSEK